MFEGDELLDDMFDSIRKAAEEWMERDLEIPTSIVAMFKKRDGKCPVDFTSLQGEDQSGRQHEILDLARKYANSDDEPWMFLLVTEAWSLKLKKGELDDMKVSPSKHPDRVETFIMSGIDDRGRQKAVLFEIVEKDGKKKMVPMSMDEDIEDMMGTWVEPKDQNPNQGVGFHDLMLESLWAEYRIVKRLYSLNDKKVE